VQNVPNVTSKKRLQPVFALLEHQAFISSSPVILL